MLLQAKTADYKEGYGISGVRTYHSKDPGQLLNFWHLSEILRKLLGVNVAEFFSWIVMHKCMVGLCAI